MKKCFFLWPSLTRQTRIITLSVVFFVLLYISLIYFSSVGPRIDDHFWYLADVESLIHGKGIQTNSIFPVQAIAGKILKNPPFIHNVPLIYIAAFFGLFMGAYSGWIFLNILCGLLTSFFIFKSMMFFVSTKKSLFFAIFYLFFPSTLWLSSQLLIEPLLSPGVAILMYLFLRKEKQVYTWVLMLVVAIFLSLCKMNFLILLFVIPVAYCFQEPKPKGFMWRGFVLFLLGFIIFSSLHPFFKNNATEYFRSSSPLAIIQVNVPDKTSGMELYFDLKKTPLQYSELWTNLILKVKRSLSLQFINFGIDGIMIYLPFNLMFLSLLASIWILKKKKYKPGFSLIYGGLFFYCLHILTICLIQNQFRYLQMVLPALIISSGGCMSILYKESWIYNQKIFKILKPLFVFLLVVSLELSSFCIVSEVRYGSNQSKIRLEVFRENIQGLISSQDVILCQGISFYTLYAYALQPNRVVFVLEDYSVTEYQTIINNVNPQWILCSENATMVQTLSLNQHLSVRLSDPMGYLMLFKLDS